MQHVGSHYSIGNTNGFHPMHFTPAVENTANVPSGPPSTTSVLRSWRKKDASEKQSTEPTSGVNTENQGPVARVAPHNHYPKPPPPTPAQTDLYRYPQQYGDYSVQNLSQLPTPVKYSEIIEPMQSIEQLPPLLQKPKEKSYIEMCNVQQNHMKPYQDYQNYKQHYDGLKNYNHVSTYKQQYHPYLQKESQIPPGYVQKEANIPPPPPHQYLHNYKMSSNYPRNYPREGNEFLANLTKIAPEMAQDIINDPHLRDPHLREPQFPVYPPAIDQNRLYQQQHHQRMYQRTSPIQHNVQNYGQRNMSQNYNQYQMNQQRMPPDPYRMYPHQRYGQVDQMPTNISPRQYHENVMGFPRISPNYPPCGQIDYQHYQHRQVPMRQEFLPIPNKPFIEAHPEIPEIVPEDSLHQPKKTLKAFLENWREEFTEDVESAEAAATDKIQLVKSTVPNRENTLYVLDAMEIPSENIPQYLHLQPIDKLPPNIRAFTYNSEENVKQNAIIISPDEKSDEKKEQENKDKANTYQLFQNNPANIGLNSYKSGEIRMEEDRPACKLLQSMANARNTNINELPTIEKENSLKVDNCFQQIQQEQKKIFRSLPELTNDDEHLENEYSKIVDSILEENTQNTNIRIHEEKERNERKTSSENNESSTTVAFNENDLIKSLDIVERKSVIAANNLPHHTVEKHQQVVMPNVPQHIIEKNQQNEEMTFHVRDASSESSEKESNNDQGIPDPSNHPWTQNQNATQSKNDYSSSKCKDLPILEENPIDLSHHFEDMHREKEEESLKNDKNENKDIYPNTFSIENDLHFTKEFNILENEINKTASNLNHDYFIENDQDTEDDESIHKSDNEETDKTPDERTDNFEKERNQEIFPQSDDDSDSDDFEEVEETSSSPLPKTTEMINTQITASNRENKVIEDSKNQYFSSENEIETKKILNDVETFNNHDNNVNSLQKDGTSQEKDEIHENTDQTITMLVHKNDVKNDDIKNKLPEVYLPKIKEEYDSDETVSEKIQDKNLQINEIGFKVKEETNNIEDNNLKENETNLTEIFKSSVENLSHSTKNDVHSIEKSVRSIENEAHSAENDVHLIENEPHSIEYDGYAIENDVHSIDNSCHLIENKVDPTIRDSAIEDDIHSIENDVHSIENDIDSIEKDIHLVEHDVYSIENDHVKRKNVNLIENVHLNKKEFSSIKNDFHSIENNVHLIADDDHLIEDDINATENDNDSIQSDDHSMEGDSHSIENDNDSIQTDDHSIEDDNHLLEHDIHSVEKEVRSIQNNHTIDNDMHTVENDVHTMENDMHSVENNVHSIENDVHSIENDIYSLEEDIHSIENDIDIQSVHSIENDVHSIENDIQDNVQSVENDIEIKNVHSIENITSLKEKGCGETIFLAEENDENISHTKTNNIFEKELSSDKVQETNELEKEKEEGEEEKEMEQNCLSKESKTVSPICPQYIEEEIIFNEDVIPLSTEQNDETISDTISVANVFEENIISYEENSVHDYEDQSIDAKNNDTSEELDAYISSPLALSHEVVEKDEEIVTNIPDLSEKESEDTNNNIFEETASNKKEKSLNINEKESIEIANDELIKNSIEEEQIQELLMEDFPRKEGLHNMNISEDTTAMTDEDEITEEIDDFDNHSCSDEDDEESTESSFVLEIAKELLQINVTYDDNGEKIISVTPLTKVKVITPANNVSEEEKSNNTFIKAETTKEVEKDTIIEKIAQVNINEESKEHKDIICNDEITFTEEVAEEIAHVDMSKELEEDKDVICNNEITFTEEIIDQCSDSRETQQNTLEESVTFEEIPTQMDSTNQMNNTEVFSPKCSSLEFPEVPEVLIETEVLLETCSEVVAGEIVTDNGENKIVENKMIEEVLIPDITLDLHNEVIIENKEEINEIVPLHDEEIQLHSENEKEIKNTSEITKVKTNICPDNDDAEMLSHSPKKINEKEETINTPSIPNKKNKMKKIGTEKRSIDCKKSQLSALRNFRKIKINNISNSVNQQKSLTMNTKKKKRVKFDLSGTEKINIDNAEKAKIFSSIVIINKIPEEKMTDAKLVNLEEIKNKHLKRSNKVKYKEKKINKKDYANFKAIKRKKQKESKNINVIKKKKKKKRKNKEPDPEIDNITHTIENITLFKGKKLGSSLESSVLSEDSKSTTIKVLTKSTEEEILKKDKLGETTPLIECSKQVLKTEQNLEINKTPKEDYFFPKSPIVRETNFVMPLRNATKYKTSQKYNKTPSGIEEKPINSTTSQTNKSLLTKEEIPKNKKLESRSSARETIFSKIIPTNISPVEEQTKNTQTPTKNSSQNHSNTKQTTFLAPQINKALLPIKEQTGKLQNSSKTCLENHDKMLPPKIPRDLRRSKSDNHFNSDFIYNYKKRRLSLEEYHSRKKIFNKSTETKELVRKDIPSDCKEKEKIVEEVLQSLKAEEMDYGKEKKQIVSLVASSEENEKKKFIQENLESKNASKTIMESFSEENALENSVSTIKHSNTDVEVNKNETSLIEFSKGDKINECPMESFSEENALENSVSTIKHSNTDVEVNKNETSLIEISKVDKINECPMEENITIENLPESESTDADATRTVIEIVKELPKVASNKEKNIIEETQEELKLVEISNEYQKESKLTCLEDSKFTSERNEKSKELFDKSTLEEKLNSLEMFLPKIAPKDTTQVEVSRKLEELLAENPIIYAQKHSEMLLIKRFLKHETLSPDELRKVRQIVQYKRAFQSFKKPNTDSPPRRRYSSDFSKSIKIDFNDFDIKRLDIPSSYVKKYEPVKNRICYNPSISAFIEEQSKKNANIKRENKLKVVRSISNIEETQHGSFKLEKSKQELSEFINKTDVFALEKEANIPPFNLLTDSSTRTSSYAESKNSNIQLLPIFETKENTDRIDQMRSDQNRINEKSISDINSNESDFNKSFTDTISENAELNSAVTNNNTVSEKVLSNIPMNNLTLNSSTKYMSDIDEYNKEDAKVGLNVEISKTNPSENGLDNSQKGTPEDNYFISSKYMPNIDESKKDTKGSLNTDILNSNLNEQKDMKSDFNIEVRKSNLNVPNLDNKQKRTLEQTCSLLKYMQNVDESKKDVKVSVNAEISNLNEHNLDNKSSKYVQNVDEPKKNIKVRFNKEVPKSNLDEHNLDNNEKRTLEQSCSSSKYVQNDKSKEDVKVNFNIEVPKSNLNEPNLDNKQKRTLEQTCSLSKYMQNIDESKKDVKLNVNAEISKSNLNEHNSDNKQKITDEQKNHISTSKSCKLTGYTTETELMVISKLKPSKIISKPLKTSASSTSNARNDSITDIRPSLKTGSLEKDSDTLEQDNEKPSKMGKYFENQKGNVRIECSPNRKPVTLNKEKDLCDKINKKSTKETEEKGTNLQVVKKHIKIVQNSNTDKKIEKSKTEIDKNVEKSTNKSYKNREKTKIKESIPSTSSLSAKYKTKEMNQETIVQSKPISKTKAQLKSFQEPIIRSETNPDRYNTTISPVISNITKLTALFTYYKKGLESGTDSTNFKKIEEIIEKLSPNLKNLPNLSDINIPSECNDDRKAKTRKDKKKRRRFRNLYTENESDEDSSSVEPNAKEAKIEMKNEKREGENNENSIDYSVYQRKSPAGVPKLVIKRRKSDFKAKLQPYVKISRVSSIESMVKKRKRSIFLKQMLNTE